jgi:glycine hydroxymethyltransferase
VFPGLQGGPLEHVIAGKAVCFGEALRDDFKAYGAQIIANARALAEELTRAGFRLASGGTDNHLILVDLTNKGVTGKVAAKALDRAGVELNYNTVPFDPRKPFDPSGIRIGTPAVTSRGMGEAEMALIAGWIDRVVSAPDDEDLIARTRDEIRELAKGFPPPGISVDD